MKKYIKEHKIVVVAVMLMIILIIISFFIKGVLFSNTNDAIYGDRLKGIDAVKMTKNEQTDLISSLEDDSSIKKAEYNLQGKLINIILTVNDEVSIDTAKSLADKVMGNFNDDQKSYFDFQVFIKKINGSKDFPIIGYKQNTKDGFNWSKDRAAE